MSEALDQWTGSINSHQHLPPGALLSMTQDVSGAGLNVQKEASGIYI
jgi:hypothetical protein